VSSECTGPHYRYQGCYDDATGPFLGRTLPQGLANSTGFGLEECAAAARGRGFPLFALQGKGQCFFGSVADLARIQASQKLPDAECSNLPCPASAATCRMTTNKVYVLIGMHACPGFCPHLKASFWACPPLHRTQFSPSPKTWHFYHANVVHSLHSELALALHSLKQCCQNRQIP
jgi:hypothetical protein